VANASGAAIGRDSTGIEIGRVDDALGFVEASRAA
jgi:translation initiation factor 6 (eIF-6)